MDSFMWNGSTVRYSPTATAIGDDLNTATNFSRPQGAAGHDVIVHSQVFDGQAQFVANGLPTHPQQIADSVSSRRRCTSGRPNPWPHTLAGRRRTVWGWVHLLQ